MKITIVMGFFLPVPPVAGGATEKTWHRLGMEFAGRGHDVTIISRSWPDWPDDETRDGLRHLRLAGSDHSARLALNVVRDLRWSIAVSRRLPPADITIVNTVTLPALPGRWRERSGRLVVMTGRVPKGQFRCYRPIDRLLAVSHAVLERVRAENPAAAERGIVTGYPIDWQRLSQRRVARGHVLTIGFVGRIHREKGLHLLAQAARVLAAGSDVPPWRLVLCGPSDVALGGSGPAFRRELEAMLGAGGRITFELRDAIFDAEALADTYAGIDVFCYPSLSAEGETFGVAVVEAMAAGAVPVVSTLPCFADYLQPGVNGEQFDPTAPDAAVRLASTLAGLLRDPERRQRLAAAAHASARSYAVPAYADRLLADFSTLK